VTLHDFEGTKLIIWLSYFQQDSRRRGRRVPKGIALPKVNLDELINASRALGLNPEPLREARYPRDRSKVGAVVVDKRRSKGATLREIGSWIKEHRQT
jgi:signal recognition particle subunit SEC65